MSAEYNAEAAASPLPPDSGMVTITLSFRKNKYEFQFNEDASVASLFEEIEATLGIPIPNQKIIVPKEPLLKASPPNSDIPLHPLQGKPLMLMGSGASEIQAVNEMSARIARRNATRQAQRVADKLASRSRPKTQANKAGDTQYTFLQVRPLQGLPNPEVSQKLLLRLKNDPGIVAVMRKHKFTVALLTEMEPLSHTETTHEGTSRILGLNRNAGEVIELRLRTDAHDGYRDYKTIRKTLCHELTHNVHSNHDRAFWELCHQVEREVQAADWKSGGNTLGESSRYDINGQNEEHQDEGGWTGGEFTLGGVRASSTGMSRREVLANAAEERQRKDAESEHKAECGWRPCRRPKPE
jgi:hypothetical protein